LLQSYLNDRLWVALLANYLALLLFGRISAIINKNPLDNIW